MARVDVIVPCYNYGRFLRDCVTSILRQSISLRILIIDDCSTDDTAEIGAALAHEDARVTFRRHATNRGHIATYNEGLDWAESPFSTIVSADDMLAPGALSRSLDALIQHPGASMAYGNAIYFRDGIPAHALMSGSVTLHSWPQNPDDAWADDSTASHPSDVSNAEPAFTIKTWGTTEFFRLNRFVNRPHMCSVVAPTELLRKTGGYRADLPHAGDFEMWLRLATHGPVIQIRAFQVLARMHDRNMSSQVYAHLINDFKQRALALDVVAERRPAGLAPGLMREMRRGLAQSAARAAAGPLEQGDRTQCEAMLALSRQLYPGIDRTLFWHLLALKRSPRLSKWLKPPSRLRPIALRLFRLT